MERERPVRKGGDEEEVEKKEFAASFQRGPAGRSASSA